MTALITTAVLGILLSVLGIVNMTGNISSLHGYHRHRITEENKKPFGRLVGLGTLIIGLCLIVFGILSHVAEKTSNPLYVTIGTSQILVGVAIGLGLSLYAMLKYNRGIF